MSTISNHSSVNSKAPQALSPEALNSNQKILPDQESKHSKFIHTIKNLNESIENKKKFQKIIVNYLNGEKTKIETMDNNDFCFETYKQKQMVLSKKLDEDEAKSKSFQKAVFDGAVKGVKIGLLLGCLIFLSKKITTSAIIMNLINCNQRFFRF